MLSGSIFQKDTRISFFFISELHHNDWGVSKFYHVACPPRGESATKEKTAKRKQYLVDFHRGKLAIKSYFRGGGGFYYIAIFSRKFCYRKIIVIFRARGWGLETTRGN